ncbi:MAG: NAD(P)/FAD-dependent oxidoreductase, partial [Halopseudomonas yangmingensis]
MAAETLANAGWPVEVCDAMPSVGRKFLLAGVGGMNLTHSEPAATFRSRYREARDWVGDWLEQLDADQLREWAQGLGIDTFVGSSGRVFPRDMKAAPLLRAWLRRLRALGVQIHTRQRWLGWSDDGQLRFSGPGGDSLRQPRATLLA